MISTRCIQSSYQRTRKHHSHPSIPILMVFNDSMYKHRKTYLNNCVIVIMSERMSVLNSPNKKNKQNILFVSRFSGSLLGESSRVQHNSLTEWENSSTNYRVNNREADVAAFPLSVLTKTAIASIGVNNKKTVIQTSESRPQGNRK